ncbi:hypothetical protein [Herpetosiphon giganteus]|uniref:hypothetical protein n=1 Tax=Herpetosiphon giganteus TaxID=2029754 RepID=UPI00195CDC69|nr:hypothetical protein [Herpetosiphon giganteus]MBM7844101.1 hypothetical protein [Herpetosiphon giganteus]
MASRNRKSTDSTNTNAVERVDIDRSYKFMIMTSFILNIVLIIGLIILAVALFGYKTGLAPLKPTIAKLTDTIDGLNNATIRASVPLNERLPISLQVPVSQNTNVRVTQAVPLSVPADITLPGVGYLKASVALNLPEGLELPVYLSMTIPLESSVPVSLTVPVNIPLSETELGPQFRSLGELVQPLADLVNGKPTEE